MKVICIGLSSLMVSCVLTQNNKKKFYDMGATCSLWWVWWLCAIMVMCTYKVARTLLCDLYCYFVSLVKLAECNTSKSHGPWKRLKSVAKSRLWRGKWAVNIERQMFKRVNSLIQYSCLYFFEGSLWAEFNLNIN